MRSILWVRFIGLKRNNKPFFLMLFLPVLFTLFFGYSNMNGKVVIPVLDEDQSELSTTLIKEWNNSELYSFESVTEDELSRRVSEGDAEGGVVIPVHFEEAFQAGEAVKMDVLKSKDSPMLISISQYVRSTAQNVLDEEMTIQLVTKTLADIGVNDDGSITNTSSEALATQQDKQPPFQISEDTVAGDGGFLYNQQLQSSLGFTLFFSIFTIVFSVAELVQDRERGIMHRVIVSPVSKYQLYGANLLYSILVGMLQMTLLILLWKTVFHFDWGDSWLLLLMVILSYVFVTASVGLFLSAFVKNLKQLNAIIPIFAVSSAMIGGAMWPIEIVKSNVLIILSKIIPLTYAMEGVKSLALYEEGFSGVWFPTVMMVGIGCVLTVISLLIMERKYAS